MTPTVSILIPTKRLTTFDEAQSCLTGPSAKLTAVEALDAGDEIGIDLSLTVTIGGDEVSIIITADAEELRALAARIAEQVNRAAD